VWKTYGLKQPDDLKLFYEKEKDQLYQRSINRYQILSKESKHEGLILHKNDANKVDDKDLIEMQLHRRMKNIYISQHFKMDQSMTEIYNKEIIRIKGNRK